LASGAGVVISQHYGAREEQRVHEAVHTAVVLSLIFGVFFTLAGYFFAPAVLRLMATPEDVFPEAVKYLRIYFCGSVPLLFYNLGSGILNAVGDSRRPLYFLVISAVVNTALDLVFVLVFHMGIDGVGWATVLAQLVSGILVAFTLCRTRECYRLEFTKLRIYAPMLRRIIQIGLPSSLQMMLVSFSNNFVQRYINTFQTACMAGWTAYNRIDSFMAVPQNALGLAATTFVGQNIGAGNIKRAKKGALVALGLCAASVAIIAVPLEIFAPGLIGIFCDTEGSSPQVAREAIDYGVIFLRSIAPLHLCLVPNSILAGALRGVGETRIPTFIQIMSFIVIRQIYLGFISQVTSEPIFIGLGYPLGWAIASLIIGLFYLFSGWEKRVVPVRTSP
ncbi:MAG: MATE family efflux transporter, partial [Oscillospiraceae bacterium]|nr:MATE family efflux transporter [Oscillospiraceae bacterium]